MKPVCDAWLIESLAELRDHAAATGLTELAEHLGEAIDLAHLEIAAQQDANAYAQSCQKGPEYHVVRAE
ncbi:MAG: hypothetical protein EA407_09310 [Rhodobacteraceae bacterium]|nr:MAG: hypothetical protein EA407_09310 [Paracoccaceae bacterium]